MMQRLQADLRSGEHARGLPIGHDFEFASTYLVPEALTARRVFSTEEQREATLRLEAEAADSGRRR